MIDGISTAADAGPLSGIKDNEDEKLVVGFVGSGRMGVPMAANLVAAGYRVVAHSRHPERAGELADLGIIQVTELGELHCCSIVISMLPDDAAARDVVLGPRRNGADGLVPILVPGTIHLSMGTISPGCAGELAVEHARYGQGYVAAPVFGNPDAARARELFIIAAGAREWTARCQPLLDVLGQKTFLVGIDPAVANVIKLVGNVMSAVNLELIGEVLALARKRGIEPTLVVDILTQTMFAGRMHRIYGGKIAGQRYEAGGFILPLALKDVRLALAEAEAAAVPMPLVSAVRDRMLTGIANGYAHLDWSALGLIAAEEAGLPAVHPPSAA
jgi:3-hydroxyisobutyrate dehydrogenase-like beta-hydroxyacid dehydrogenase